MISNTEYREKGNILIMTYDNPYNPLEDTGTAMQELTKRLAANSDKLHFISDLSRIKVSFSDLVAGLAQAYTTPGSIFADPRLLSYVVGDDEMVRLGAKAASEQRQYGKVSVKIYASVDEALKEIIGK